MYLLAGEVAQDSVVSPATYCDSGLSDALMLRSMLLFFDIFSQISSRSMTASSFISIS